MRSLLKHNHKRKRREGENLRLTQAASQTTIKSRQPIFNCGGNLVRSIQEHFECMMKVNWVSTSSTDSTASPLDCFLPPMSMDKGGDKHCFPKQWATSNSPSPIDKLAETGTRIFCMKTVCESKKSC